MQLLAPQAAREATRFPTAALAEIKIAARHARDARSPLPPYFPESGGLLPWARDGGLLLYFQTDPAVPPGRWPIVAPPGYPARPDTAGVAESAVRFVAHHLGLDQDSTVAAALDASPPIEMRRSPTTMSPATPTVRAAFQRVETGLRAHHASLRPGAGAQELTQAQAEVRSPLPEAVCDYFETHDGAQAGTELLLYGGQLCSLAEMVKEWRAMTDLQHDGSFDGFEIDAEADPGIRSDLWWRDGWLPLVARDGDYLVLDLDPAPDGTLGQVFAWSRLDGAGMLAAPSIAAWLESWADELPSAKPPKSVDELVHRPGSPVWPVRD